MAYNDASFGFIPVRADWSKVELGWVDSSDNTAIYPGDPVIIDGTSNTAAVTAVGAGTKAIGMVKGYTRATAGATNKVSGVCIGVQPVTQDSLVYRAASTERLIMVLTDPHAVYRVQADDAVAAADIGSNTNILFTHAGANSQSGAEVDATASADATYQCRLEGFWDDPQNEANSTGNQVLVSFALHTQGTAGGSLGV